MKKLEVMTPSAQIKLAMKELKKSEEEIWKDAMMLEMWHIVTYVHEFIQDISWEALWIKLTVKN